LQKIQLNGRCYVNRIPSWFRSVPALTYLRIDIKEVKNGDLGLLSELPSLRHLSLSSRTVPTEKLVIRRDGFPVLQEFQLCSVRPDLAFEPQATRMLETLLLSLHVLPEETHGFSISIDQFMCLKQIEIRIERKPRVVDASEVFQAQNIDIRNAVGHTNCPAVRIIHANLIVKSLNVYIRSGARIPTQKGPISHSGGQTTILNPKYILIYCFFTNLFDFFHCIFTSCCSVV
jgi:hypothetical protein